MRIVFIGCVEFSYRCLELLFEMDIKVVGVVTRRESPANTDFRSLEPLAQRHDCPLCYVERRNYEPVESFVESLKPDVIYCFGWSYLLPMSLLTIAPLGAIGFHPAALPQNRGRHPLIWALALGLRETASTFFFMSDDADSGDVISQEPIAIEIEDDARSLYDKVTETALSQIRRFTPALASRQLSPKKQDSKFANVWRKRTVSDGEIDWRMSREAIVDLVRALTRPYVGAHCVVKNQNVRIWRADIGPDSPPNLEPGKVLEISDRAILVKCWGGSVLLLEHDFVDLPREGDYL